MCHMSLVYACCLTCMKNLNNNGNNNGKIIFLALLSPFSLFSFSFQVYIKIENENDNVPLTEQPVYYPSVLENSPAGTKIIQLEATDDDGDVDKKISYKLISGNPEGFFAINTTTGK